MNYLAKNLVRKIFQQHIGYDVMPERGELVVLDSQIPLSLAYEAFVYHGIILSKFYILIV